MIPHVGGVLVGHAHQRLSEGLRHWLQASFDSVYMVGDRASLVDGARKLQPALMVVDLALAQGDLPTLAAELHASAPASRMLLLSDYDDAGADAAALSAGADGVVHKATLASELSAAVDTVLAGRRYFCAAAGRPGEPGGRIDAALRGSG